MKFDVTFILYLKIKRFDDSHLSTTIYVRDFCLTKELEKKKKKLYQFTEVSQKKVSSRRSHYDTVTSSFLHLPLHFFPVHVSHVDERHQPRYLISSTKGRKWFFPDRFKTGVFRLKCFNEEFFRRLRTFIRR